MDPHGLPPRLRWSVWLFGLIAWTYLLVVPVDWLPSFLRFGGGDGPSGLSWGKIGHSAAYATLALLVPLLPVARNGRFALWGVLVAHACTTELVQTLVPTRSGAFSDVAIDLAGFAVGVLLGQLWPRDWRAPAIDSHQHASREDQNADLLRYR